MSFINQVKFLVIRNITRLINQNTVVVPFSLVSSRLMYRLKPFSFIYILLVPVGTVNKIPVDKLNQKEYIEAMANQISNIVFESKCIPSVINIIFDEPCSENIKFIGLTNGFHQSTILFADTWKSYECVLDFLWQGIFLFTEF